MVPFCALLVISTFAAERFQALVHVGDAVIAGLSFAQIKSAPIIGHFHQQNCPSRTEIRSQPGWRAAWRTTLVSASLKAKKSSWRNFGIERMLRQIFGDIQAARNRGEIQQPLRIGAEVTRQRRDGVVARIDCPDDFIQRSDHAPRGLAQFAKITFLFFGGRGRAFDERGEHVDFREAGAEVIVQIMRHPCAFLFDFAPALGELAFLDLDFQFARAFRDPPAQHRHPDKCRQRDETRARRRSKALFSTSTTAAPAAVPRRRVNAIAR